MRSHRRFFTDARALSPDALVGAPDADALLIRDICVGDSRPRSDHTPHLGLLGCFFLLRYAVHSGLQQVRSTMQHPLLMKKSPNWRVTRNVACTGTSRSPTHHCRVRSAGDCRTEDDHPDRHGAIQRARRCPDDGAQHVRWSARHRPAPSSTSRTSPASRARTRSGMASGLPPPRRTSSRGGWERHRGRTGPPTIPICRAQVRTFKYVVSRGTTTSCRSSAASPISPVWARREGLPPGDCRIRPRARQARLVTC